jgi:hypothetical protein
MPHFKPPNIKTPNMSFKVASDLQRTYGPALSAIPGRKGTSGLLGRLDLPTVGSHHVS